MAQVLEDGGVDPPAPFAEDPEIGGGLIALDLDDGSVQWYTPPRACGDRLRCSPAQPGAVTVIAGVAFAGSMTGVLRAYSTVTLLARLRGLSTSQPRSTAMW